MNDSWQMFSPAAVEAFIYFKDPYPAELWYTGPVVLEVFTFMFQDI